MRECLYIATSHNHGDTGRKFIWSLSLFFVYFFFSLSLSLSLSLSESPSLCLLFSSSLKCRRTCVASEEFPDHRLWYSHTLRAKNSEPMWLDAYLQNRLIRWPKVDNDWISDIVYSCYFTYTVYFMVCLCLKAQTPHHWQIFFILFLCCPIKIRILFNLLYVLKLPWIKLLKDKTLQLKYVCFSFKGKSKLLNIITQTCPKLKSETEWLLAF